ncbi:Myb-DNA-bind-2 domain-containing protein [Mycena venus]|uniref:Myb-DNA-bind-2 domain-containing protein n=1 Tax=Mycena venus TaxID=2733690 RepID=A0A8H6WYE4_9AGAR|nr:Myb-DNA-bind-2 domain-containing protein [Mycena venus]
MPANGRNPFTRDDDALLVKYLAKYNPGIQGRSGNKIYKLLCDNEHNKWAWSSHHPWAGWRDRYTKNQTEFNEKIKEYQIKKGLPTENSMWVNGTQKLKGSDAEGEDVKEESRLKRKRTSSDDARKRAKRSSSSGHEENAAKGSSSAEPEADDNEGNSATDPESDPPPPVPTRPRRTHVPDIYPDIAVLDEPSPRDNNNTHPKPPSTRPPRKVKPTLIHNPDSDFFASVPPTPTTTASRPPTTASGSRASVTSNTSVHEPQPQPSTSKPKLSRGLPKLVEGTFRSFFAGVRQWTGGDARSSDDESPRKEKEWSPVRARKVPSEKAGDDMEIEEQTENSRDRRTKGRSVNGPVELGAGEDMEVVELQSATARGDTEKAKRLSVTQPAPARIPARRPPQHVNAVASSSRAQLTPRHRPSSSHRTPAAQPQIQPQHNETPHHEQSPRRQSSLEHPGSHHSYRSQCSPSPLDWGSPVGPENDNASASSPVATTSSPLKTRQVLIRPPRGASPQPSRNDRRSLSGSVPDPRSSARENDPSRAPSLPRLSFTDIGGSNSTRGSLRNRNRNPSIGSGSVDPGSLPRRSRAEASTDGHPPQYHYHLASPPAPPRAVVSSRRQTDDDTPLERKAKRRAQGQLPFGFKPTTLIQQDETRRHSLPAALPLPRIDFDRMHGSTRPRQSLPPPASSHHHDREPLPRRRSLFSPCSPAVAAVSSAPTSASVSPMQLSISANDHILFEHVGLQALMEMAKNHGFGLEVVRNVYARSGDLRKTDEVLLRMRRKAEAEGEAALRGADEGPPELGLREEEHRRRRRHSGVTATRDPPEPEPPEQPFELRRRRQYSGATATTTVTRSPSSSQRKKQQQRHQHQADEFRPQPLGARPRGDGIHATLGLAGGRDRALAEEGAAGGGDAARAAAGQRRGDAFGVFATRADAAGTAGHGHG